MEFFRFLRKEHDDYGPKTILVTASAGLVNSALAMILIYAAQHAAPHKFNFKYLLMFVVAVAAFWASKSYALNKNTIMIEQVLEKVRMRIADKIRKTDLKSFEDIGKARFFSTLNTDTQTLSQFTPILTNSVSSAVMMFFALVYVAFISFPAFIIVIVVTTAALIHFYSAQKKLNQKLAETSELQEEYYAALDELLGGFKELKINATKSNDFYERRLGTLSQSMESLKIQLGLSYNRLGIFAQSFSYLLLASIVFVIPMLTPDNTANVVKIVAILLFIVGPLAELVGNTPILAKCTLAISNIYSIESELDTLREKSHGTTRGDSDSNADVTLDFNTIEMKSLEFSYFDADGAQGFKLGPIDFEIRKGETVFVIGGNGGGKSTFLKLFTALYTPHSGEIAIDGDRLHAADRVQYRNLFSTIFTDFHLFKYLYGVDSSDEKNIRELLDKMQLSDRCEIVDGTISDINLSTGQRKRMALIASLLEDKDLYIFDEWAADQDPDFRRSFYTELLPKLKAEGKTVLAATHDDHYFQYADRVIKLDAGVFEDYVAPAKNAIRSVPNND